MRNADDQSNAAEDEKAGGEEKKLDKKEIDALLKYGAYDVFREGQDEGEQYYEEDIDKILERSSFTLKPESQGAITSFAWLARDFLSLFLFFFLILFFSCCFYSSRR